MIGKLRTQLLLFFLVFGFINSTIITTYIIQSKQKNKIEEIENYIHQIEVLIHSDTREINNFFTYETKNSMFFYTNESKYINKHNHQSFIINLIKKRLINAKGFEKITSKNQVNKLSIHLDSLNSIFIKMSELIYLRGYANFGIEGEMQTHAYNMETTMGVPLYELLMLRKAEKDYIIRKDQIYINLFNSQIIALKEAINQSPQMQIRNKKYLLQELQLYATSFTKIVAIDTKLGLENNSALKAELDKVTQQVISDKDLLKQNCNIYKTNLYKKLEKASVFSLTSIIIISVLLSFKFSRMITYRISLLSANTNAFINSCFTNTEPLNIKTRNDEVGKLIINFEMLKQKITDQLNYLEIKVKERTEEINTQKEQILIQNKKLMDSLRYALNIQEAILPNKDYISNTFPEHFIFYRPKDLVSGDFYWFKRITKSKVDYSVFAVADCTGHGVPGAFMSMLGIAFLNEIVVHKKFKNSADILNQLRKKTIENLSQQNNSKVINDGMDIALVVLNQKERKLQFSGAMRDLSLVRKNELYKYSGDRMPIGSHLKDNKSFMLQEVRYKKNDIIYLFSDGFADQFGGPNMRKYLRKNLRKLLVDLSYYPMIQQKTLIEREFNSWMSTTDQTDDICLAGIKLS